jgi:hypothetical protein
MNGKDYDVLWKEDHSENSPGGESVGTDWLTQ